MKPLLAILSFIFVTILGLSLSANAAVIFDVDRNQAIGSATPFCFGLQQDRYYFFTAQHVTKGVAHLSVGGLFDLEPMQTWPSLDLALYMTKPSNVMLAIPCQEFSLQLSVPEIHTLEQLHSMPEVLVTLTGFDAQTQKDASRKVRTRVASIEVGREGYAKIPLMVLETSSGPGLSGGVITADVENGTGKIANQTFGEWPAIMIAGYSNEAIGIVIGRSKDGQRTYAISAIQFRLLTGQFPGMDLVKTREDVARIKTMIEDLKNLVRKGGFPEDIVDSGTGRLVE